MLLSTITGLYADVFMNPVILLQSGNGKLQLSPSFCVWNLDFMECAFFYISLSTLNVPVILFLNHSQLASPSTGSHNYILSLQFQCSFYLHTSVFVLFFGTHSGPIWTWWHNSVSKEVSHRMAAWLHYKFVQRDIWKSN